MAKPFFLQLKTFEIKIMIIIFVFYVLQIYFAKLHIKFMIIIYSQLQASPT